MKRASELRALSVEHHHGLVLARRARKAAAGSETEVEAMWAQVLEKFAAELEPHFQIEEQYMLPGLERAGEQEVIDQLNEEHVVLRGLVAPESDRSAANLARFGELLDAHIRFEEREFFVAVERCLTPAEMQAIEAAGQ